VIYTLRSCTRERCDAVTVREALPVHAWSSGKSLAVMGLAMAGIALIERIAGIVGGGGHRYPGPDAVFRRHYNRSHHRKCGRAPGLRPGGYGEQDGPVAFHCSRLQPADRPLCYPGAGICLTGSRQPDDPAVQSAGADRPHRRFHDLCPRLTGWGVQLAGGSHAPGGLWHTGPGILLPVAEAIRRPAEWA